MRGSKEIHFYDRELLLNHEHIVTLRNSLIAWIWTAIMLKEASVFIRQNIDESNSCGREFQLGYIQLSAFANDRTFAILYSGLISHHVSNVKGIPRYKYMFVFCRNGW